MLNELAMRSSSSREITSLDPGKTIGRALFHQLHRSFRAKAAVAQRDVIHRRPAFAVVLRKGRDRIVMRNNARVSVRASRIACEPAWLPIGCIG